MVGRKIKLFFLILLNTKNLTPKVILSKTRNDKLKFSCCFKHLDNFCLFILLKRILYLERIRRRKAEILTYYIENISIETVLKVKMLSKCILLHYKTDQIK